MAKSHQIKAGRVVQGRLPLYLDRTVFGARCKQIARVGEAEVQNLVTVLLQGLHFHTGDGVIEPLELIIPGDGSCNVSRDRNVSGGKQQT